MDRVRFAKKTVRNRRTEQRVRTRIFCPSRSGLFALAVAATGLAAALPAQAMDLAAPQIPFLPMPFSVTSGMDGTMDHGSMDHGTLGHSHIPAGVFGGGMVGAGGFMLSYTPMFMHMADNYVGSSTVSDRAILNTKTPAPVMMGGMAMNFYRIVPTSMDVQSHMFHAMYGVTDWLNLMVMGSFLQKSMTMTTYNMKGTGIVGSSTAQTSGIGDTMVTSLWRLYQDQVHHLHLNFGLSLPSGSTTEQISMLSPMGSYMNMRANYGMQLGTGTVDFLPGVSYTGHIAQWSWGMIYRGRFPLGDNSEGYRYGNLNEWSGWAGYTLIPGITLTGRAVGSIQGQIHGADSQISGLMQGTNPAFYGGKRIDLLGGIEMDGAPLGLGPAMHLDVEGGAPVFQDLNGPQLGRAWQLTVAARLGF